jgi:hypothetical protein
MKINDLDRFKIAYLSLILSLNKLYPSYEIDFNVYSNYFPKNLNSKNIGVNDLLLEIDSLLDYLEDSGEISKERRRNLRSRIISIKTEILIRNGHKIDEKTITNLYGLPKITPEYSDSDIRRLENQYLSEVTNTHSINHKIEDSMKKEVINTSLKIAQDKTYNAFPLESIPHESVEIEYSTDFLTGAYCTYLGNYKSKVTINTEFDQTCLGWIPLLCHEVYPGHHLQNIFQNKYFIEDLQLFEYLLVPHNSPQSVINEGLAMMATEVIFENEELMTEIANKICRHGSSKLELLEDYKQSQLLNDMNSKLIHNMFYKMHIKNETREEVRIYGTSFEYFNDKNIGFILDKFEDATMGTQHIVYDIGYNLIKNKTRSESSKQDYFNLLSNPILPDDLV